MNRSLNERVRLALARGRINCFHPVMSNAEFKNCKITFVASGPAGSPASLPMLGCDSARRRLLSNCVWALCSLVSVAWPLLSDTDLREQDDRSSRNLK